MATNEAIADSVAAKIKAANPANKDLLLEHLDAALAANRRSILNDWNSGPIANHYDSILGFPLRAPSADQDILQRELEESRKKIRKLEQLNQDMNEKMDSIEFRSRLSSHSYHSVYVHVEKSGRRFANSDEFWSDIPLVEESKVIAAWKILLKRNILPPRTTVTEEKHYQSAMEHVMDCAASGLDQYRPFTKHSIGEKRADDDRVPDIGVFLKCDVPAWASALILGEIKPVQNSKGKKMIKDAIGQSYSYAEHMLNSKEEIGWDSSIVFATNLYQIHFSRLTAKGEIFTIKANLLNPLFEDHKKLPDIPSEGFSSLVRLLSAGPYYFGVKKAPKPFNIEKGRVTPVGFLAHGAKSIVWSANLGKNEEKVAVKMSSQGTLRAMAHECNVFQKLKNTNCSSILFPLHMDSEKIVFKPLDCTLQQLVQSGVVIAASAAVICSEILDALEALFSCNLIHTDVRPSNIMMGDKNTFLIDFDSCLTEGMTTSQPRGTITFAANSIIQSLKDKSKYTFSRSTDLESLLYVFIYLIKGGVSWDKVMEPQEIIDLRAKTIEELKVGDLFKAAQQSNLGDIRICFSKYFNESEVEIEL